MADRLGLLRLSYRVPLLLLHFFVGTPFTVLCQFLPAGAFSVGGRPFSEVALTWWAGVVCRIFGVERRLVGCLEEGPLMVAANHISWIDIPLLHSLGAMGFVAKAEIGRWPLVGWLARVGQTVFHERGSPDSASGVQAAMTERLLHGGRVAIFPEGGILPGEGVKRFHARLFGPAIETGAAVKPVMLRYVRAGQLLDDITFRPGEHFLANFFRLLTQKRCIAEVHALASLNPAGRQRRQLAFDAETAIRATFDQDVPRG